MRKKKPTIYKEVKVKPGTVEKITKALEDFRRLDS